MFPMLTLHRPPTADLPPEATPQSGVRKSEPGVRDRGNRTGHSRNETQREREIGGRMECELLTVAATIHCCHTQSCIPCFYNN